MKTIAVRSPDYLTARFPQQEWAAALARDPTGERGSLLPVRIRKCNIEGLLGPIVFIDLVELDEAAAKQGLLDGVQRERSARDKHRLFPSRSHRRWAGIAVHVVNASFPEDSEDVQTWPICLPLLPHASATLTHVEAIQFASNETARLFNQDGIYLYARAEYAQAKRMIERALTIDEAAFGPNHPSVAIRLNNLGGVLQSQGDLTGAKALYEQSLQIFREFLGDDHPHQDGAR
jgi:Tfp pilus assembly protein PilF